MGYDEAIAIKIAYQINSGYWKVFNRCFFDKAECLRFASRIRNYNVTYHFYDEVYTKLDWTKVPEQSLDSMYAERARKIREKYKYVALLFSGGCDSTNMLRSFLNNNIEIDEVISFYPIEASNKLLHTFNRKNTSTENTIFEYHEVVVPTFEYLKNQYPNLKLTVLDYTRPALSFISNGVLDKLFISGVTGNGHTSGYYMSYEHVSRYDNSCLVIGIDKPRILYDKINNKFKSYFFDFNTIHGHFPKDTFKGDQPGTEYFYYDPEMPYITVKQCNQILEGLTKVLDPTHPCHKEVLADKGNRYIVDVHHNYVKSLLYPGWNTNIFQAGKPASDFFFEMNNWMLKTDLTDQRVKDFAFGQGKEFSYGIDPKFLTFDDKGVPQGFISMFTKPNLLH